MTKFLYISFALLAVFCIISCEEIGNEAKSKMFKKFLKERKKTLDESLGKLEKMCPGVTEKFNNAGQSFLKCVKKIDDTLTICQAIQSSTLNCTEPVLKVIDDCLPPRSRGLPTLGVKMFLSVTNFMCNQHGESLFELFNPCIWKDADVGDDDSEEDDECEDLEGRFDQIFNGTTTPSQSQFCSFASFSTDCAVKDSTKSCKNAKSRNFSLGLAKALTAPCDSIDSKM